MFVLAHEWFGSKNDWTRIGDSEVFCVGFGGDFGQLKLFTELQLLPPEILTLKYFMAEICKQCVNKEGRTVHSYGSCKYA